MMDEEDVFEFNQAGLASSYLTTLEAMRQDDVLCDVTIYVRNQSFRAHRTILAAGIPYFRVMFTINMKESISGEITMKDVDPLALELLINFAYTNKLRITRSNAVPLLKTSLYLQLDCVRNACVKYITKRFDPDTVLPFYKHAAMPNNVEILEMFSCYIRDNFHRVSMSKEFLNLPFLSIKEFICKDDLNVTSEEIVFEAVMKWVKASEPDREAYLPELLLHTRMTLLSPEYLLSDAYGEKLIYSSSVCRRLVKDAVFSKIPSKREMPCIFNMQKRYSRDICSGLYAIFHTEGLKTSIQWYDTPNKTWSTLCDHELLGHADYFACTDKKIYFLGGRFAAALSLETQELTPLSCNGRFPVGAGIALYQEQVYFFGGQPNSGYEISRFDPNLGILDEFDCLLKSRTLPGVASLGDYIYITGGRKLAVFRSCEKYSPNRGQTSRISPMNQLRFGHGCAALNGEIYVCGGRTDSYELNSFTRSSEVYNPRTNHWQFVESPNKVTGCMSLVPHVFELYAVSSKKQEDNYFHVEIYDPSADEWKSGGITPCFSSCKNVTALVKNSASYLKAVAYLEYEAPLSDDEVSDHSSEATDDFNEQLDEDSSDYEQHH